MVLPRTLQATERLEGFLRPGDQSLLEEDHARLKVLRAIVEAETPGGRKAAIDSLRKLAEQSGSGPQVFVIRTLHLLGDGEYAEQVTKRWLASEKVSTTVQAQLEYLAGEMEAEELLDRARKSRFTLATAHHAIAMKCLGEGDREGAMRHFRASLDSSVYAASSLSRAFLERMEAGWPPWVPAEERSE